VDRAIKNKPGSQPQVNKPPESDKPVEAVKPPEADKPVEAVNPPQVNKPQDLLERPAQAKPPEVVNPAQANKPPAFVPVQQRRVGFNFKKILLAALLIYASLFGAYLLYKFLTREPDLKRTARPKAAVVVRSEPQTKKVSIEQSITQKVTQAVTAIKEGPKKPAAQFVLNGVFFSQNEGCALINNHIVKKGDTVEGAVVKQIRLDEVELESDGAVITLKAASK
jgi:hypothetical protein